MPRKSLVKLFRPPEFTGKGDRYLPKIQTRVTALLEDLYAEHDLLTLDLPDEAFPQIAAVIVEFAEDIHNDIGIWRAYEHYNADFFGTPLPLMLKPGKTLNERDMFTRRLKHFLWTILPEFDPGLILSPTFKELDLIAEPVAELLIEAFAEVPTDSGIARFLQEPVTYAWDVKRKLVWLGQASYFFRFFFGNYIEQMGGNLDVPTIDDFACQYDSPWSGLGVIDILAAVLDIDDERRREIRSWYERHTAIYKITSISKAKGILKVLNVVNEKIYEVRMDAAEMTQFTRNRYVQGALVPWDGYWYWSGVQQDYGKIPQMMLDEIILHFRVRMTAVSYRYCDDALNQAKAMLQRQYDEFLKYHGSDLVFYSDGAALADDTEKELQAYTESIKAEQGIEEAPLAGKPLLPPEVLEEYKLMENGVAVYFNPAEGQEILDDFNLIISGLEKQGFDLTDDEEDMLREFIQSDVISPGFVRRVAGEYGSRSISAAFFISDPDDTFVLEYVLRRYKGFFFRKRYPSIAVYPHDEMSEDRLLNLFSS